MGTQSKRPVTRVGNERPDLKTRTGAEILNFIQQYFGGKWVGSRKGLHHYAITLATNAAVGA